MRNRNPKKEILYSTLMLVIPLAVLFSVYFLINSQEPEVVVEETPIEERLVDPFAKVNIIGQAAIVKDLNTGEVLYSKNSRTSMPLASLAKVMTAVVTRHLTDDNPIVILTPEAIATEGNSFLYTGERFRLRDLIDYMLVTSSNDGAAAIAAAVQNLSVNNSFVEEMNAFADQIGMRNSFFLNETGLDKNEELAGAFGTAEDVAILFEYALTNYSDIFEATRETNLVKYSESGLLHKAKNTNEIVGELPNLLGSKTGYTDIAGGNLAVIIDPGLNTPVVLVVLGSTQEGRFTDIKTLSNKVQEYYLYKSQ